jgi:hypothetical protein
MPGPLNGKATLYLSPRRARLVLPPRYGIHRDGRDHVVV